MAGLTSQNVDKLSRKRLVGLVKNDMGYTDDDFDFKTISKDELVDIVKNHMGKDMYQGGLATKNYVNPVKIVDNRKNKK